MKTRLAKKIVGRIFSFKEYESNYLPYSKRQQTKAVKIAFRSYSITIRLSNMEFLPTKKVPLKWRKTKGFIPGEFDNLKSE